MNKGINELRHVAWEMLHEPGIPFGIIPVWTAIDEVWGDSMTAGSDEGINTAISLAEEAFGLFEKNKPADARWSAKRAVWSSWAGSWNRETWHAREYQAWHGLGQMVRKTISRLGRIEDCLSREQLEADARKVVDALQGPGISSVWEFRLDLCLRDARKTDAELTEFLNEPESSRKWKMDSCRYADKMVSALSSVSNLQLQANLPVWIGGLDWGGFAGYPSRLLMDRDGEKGGGEEIDSLRSRLLFTAGDVGLSVSWQVRSDIAREVLQMQGEAPGVGTILQHGLDAMGGESVDDKALMGIVRLASDLQRCRWMIAASYDAITEFGGEASYGDKCGVELSDALFVGSLERALEDAELGIRRVVSAIC